MPKLLSLAFFFLLSGVIQAQNVLNIKIIDEENLNMPGANVQLKPGNRKAISNQSGVATFQGLNTGRYTLIIEYVGYHTSQKAIEVKAGSNTFTEQLKSGVNIMKEVMVLGDRLKGQAKALNQQKNNLNITNVISSEQVGRFPDANIGDAIRRVPGITMQNDQGEARNIIIRGMGPELNSVNLNGERIPSAEGDNRRIQMDLIPADVIQTIEVSKTLTAEMDADAIGGSVNLITRAPSNGLRISGTIAGGSAPIRNGFNGTANFIIGNRTRNKKIGYLVNGSFNSNDYGSDNVEAVWSKDANGKLYVSDHDIRKYDVKRVRRALSATFDFKLAPNHTLYLVGNYNWRDDLENRYRLRHRFRGGATNLIYNSAGEITGYNNGEVLRQTKGGVANDRSESRRLEDQRVRTLQLRGDHLFGKVKVDWSAQYAKASEFRPNERYVSMGRRSIQVTQDISEREFPLLTSTTPLSSYTRLNELTEENQVQYEEDFNMKLGFSQPIATGGKTILKYGLRLRDKTKVRDNNFFQYTPIGTMASSFANITLLGLGNQDPPRGFYGGGKYRVGSFVDPVFLGRFNFKDAASFRETDAPAEYLAGNYRAKETITAGYVQVNHEWTDKIKMVAGLRLENTAINYTGNIVEDEDTFKGEAKLKNSYLNVLPSVNFRYAATDNMIWRLALTTGIARPKYYDLVPYFNILPSDNELSAGNPALQPIKSTNIDLMFERYFKSVGILSGGIFYKRLNNFFYTYRDENYTRDKFASDFPNIVNNPIVAGDNWQFLQRRNGSAVDVVGFEVAYQRQLDFLPGFWKGFGIYTNYTYTKSRAKGIYDGSGNLIRSDVTLPGTAPHMFNGSLSYENKKLVLRVSLNYTAAYVDDSDDAGYNEDAFFDRYYDKQLFLDFNGSYAFTKMFRVFVEANNLSNEPLRYYQGSRERTAQLEYYGHRVSVGFKFDLIK
jgi:TonB-dependent receptor